MQKISIKKQNTTAKNFSPTKFSNHNKNHQTKGSRRGGNSKTFQEIRKIVEKWPHFEQTIEVLKNGENLNNKNIYKLEENLSEFKKEMQDSLKKKIASIYNTVKEEIKNLKDQITDRIKSSGIETCAEDITTLNLKIEKLNVQFNSVYQQTKENKRILKEIEELSHTPFGSLLHGDQIGPDETVVNELREEVDTLKKNLNKLKAETFRSIQDCENKLFKKADEEVVNDVEEALHQGIDQIMTSSSKKFADRRDTNKAVRLLEQNMKNMYDLFLSRDDPGDVDDAMFSRKNPGFTCMSCEKNIINMEGRKADYNNWGKLPFRDPSERMLRVGHGFSKMLGALKTNISKMSKDQSKKPRSKRNLSLDPDMNNNTEIKQYPSSSLLDIK